MCVCVCVRQECIVNPFSMSKFFSSFGTSFQIPEMAKRFKFRFSLSTFQFCRSKQPSTLPKSPVKMYMFSPVNPKAFDIPHPNFPDPPPSTPNDLSFTSYEASKIIPVCSTNHRVSRSNTHSPEQELNKENGPHLRTINSLVSDESDYTRMPITPPRAQKKTHKIRTKIFRESVPRSNSSADSWYSSLDEDHDKETESLVLSSTSFDSSNEFDHAVVTLSNRHVSGYRRKNTDSAQFQRSKVNASKHCQGGNKKLKKATEPENETLVRKLVFGRFMPCRMDGKVNGSFVLVKKSEDPYDDFKRSMLEMILEKQIFEVEELELLLQCFLSLNSHRHHPVIVGAFSDIWEVLFCGSPKSQTTSVGM